MTKLDRDMTIPIAHYGSDHESYIGGTHLLEPVLVGSLLEIVLFGVLIVQMHDYHRRFPRDRTVLKLAAWGAFLGSGVLTIAISVDLWERVTDLTLIPTLADMTPSTKAAHAMIAILGFASQLFFAWRIFQLCHKWWLLLLMCSLSVPAFVCLLLADLQPGIADASSRSLGTIVTPIWMGFSMFCDLTITLSMITLLYNALREAIFRRTRRTLAHILAFTLETGLLTTLLIAVQMALMLEPLAAHADGGSERRWRCIFFYPTGAVYASWVLASLNARSAFARGDTFFVSSVSGLPTTCPGDAHAESRTTQQTKLAAKDAVVEKPRAAAPGEKRG
ncbi:hypothetical protein PLEOSDRAFT_1106104 [Pleurotus ostreatus PC15]|uniref:DUF6534 domain-containing protein n=1 Tax=Pleurotus ostreatus (strain PC15) TaxID=1137138 RepID=A0A067NBC4_PLEO1|nr:hypothetical protein PLEOSDRAFT_1106104 [Pleurotus ostreatus PC15]